MIGSASLVFLWTSGSGSAYGAAQTVDGCNAHMSAILPRRAVIASAVADFPVELAHITDAKTAGGKLAYCDRFHAFTSFHGGFKAFSSI